jgi:hypothetical protein
MLLSTCGTQSIDTDTSRNSHSSDPQKCSCEFKIDKFRRAYRRTFRAYFEELFF